MDSMYTANDLKSYSDVLEEGKEYIIYNDDVMTLRYYSNYILVKEPISQEVFQHARLLYLGQQHRNDVPFEAYLVQDKAMTPDLREWFMSRDFTISKNLVMKINSKDYLELINTNLKIEEVTEDDVEAFNDFACDDELARLFGEDYRIQKREFYKKIITLPESTLLKGTLNGDIAGYCIMNDCGTHFEIDELYANPEYRNIRVASTLQTYIMKHADGKDVILAADDDDTPKVMYEKQGYTLESTFYQVIDNDKN